MYSFLGKFVTNAWQGLQQGTAIRIVLPHSIEVPLLAVSLGFCIF